MFTIENWEKGFLWVDFKEHPFIDIREQEPGLFDVSTKAYPDYASDFMRNNAFDQRQYCICLLRTTLELSMDGMVDFLKYQCTLMENPLEWLYKFDELLEIADKFKPTESNKIRFKILGKLIGDLCVEMADFAAEPRIVYPSFGPADSNELKEKFELVRLVDTLEGNPGLKHQISILKKLRADYFRDRKDAKKEDSFVRFVDMVLRLLKKVIKVSKKKENLKKFRGTGKQLVRFYSNMRRSKNKEGAFVTNMSVSEEARWISDNYCDKDGKLYPESTIRKYLTDNNRSDFYDEKYK
mgnify:CR=1 FL=1